MMLPPFLLVLGNAVPIELKQRERVINTIIDNTTSTQLMGGMGEQGEGNETKCKD